MSTQQKPWAPKRKINGKTTSKQAAGSEDTAARQLYKDSQSAPTTIYRDPQKPRAFYPAPPPAPVDYLEMLTTPEDNSDRSYASTGGEVRNAAYWHAGAYDQVESGFWLAADGKWYPGFLKPGE